MSDVDIELSRVSKNVYRESDNSQLNSLVEEEQKKAVYGKNKRFVGWKVFDKKDWERHSAHYKKKKYRSQKGEKFYVRLNKEQNLLGILGQIGSGKTVILRGFSNRGFEAGVRGIHLADVKGDMHSNNYKGGAQKKIDGSRYRNLRDLENPKPIPTLDLMPYFIREYNDGDVETWNQFFQFSFDDLTSQDFKTMMPTDTKNKESKVNQIYDLLSDGEIDGLDSVGDWLDNQDMNYSNRNSLATTVDNIIRNGVIGNDYNVDIPALLADNDTFIAVNMSGHEDVPTGFPQMYVGKNVRDLARQKERSTGIIPKSEPVELYLDEAHEFLEEGNVAEKWIKKLVKKRRNLGFRVIWATHFLNDFDNYNGSSKASDLPEIVRQTKQFILSPEYGADSARVLLKHCGIWRSQDYDMWREVFELMKELKKRGIYVWLYINSDGDWCVFESASSLANHG